MAESHLLTSQTDGQPLEPALDPTRIWICGTGSVMREDPACFVRSTVLIGALGLMFFYLPLPVNLSTLWSRAESISFCVEHIYQWWGSQCSIKARESALVFGGVLVWGEGANGNKLLCAAELWKERQNTEQKASDHQICYLHLPEIISFLIVIAIVWVFCYQLYSFLEESEDVLLLQTSLCS